MKVSGWVRVWIVASVIWWAGGAVWISRVNFSGAVMPSLWYTMPDCVVVDDGDPNNPFYGMNFSRTLPSCTKADISRDRVYWGENWETWLRRAWDSGGLQLLFLGPFVLGALMLGVSWIIRGFRPEAAKGGADANKPPPVGPA